jgi:branched-chain amino acid transport system ATP-binding protein
LRTNPDAKQGRRAPVELSEVSVSYGGVVAVDRITTALPGGVVAVVGPNGAGKTSLFNAITGYTPLAGGEVKIWGEAVRRPDPVRLRMLGLSRTFQQLELFQEMSVLENLLVGEHVRMRYSMGSAGLSLPSRTRDERRALDSAQSILKLLALERYSADQVGALSYGVQKRVALGRALAGDPKLLLLDEPASGLTHDEVVEAGHLIRMLAQERGIDVVLVEHNMSFVAEVADWVVVMNQGRLMTQGQPQAVISDPFVVEAYIGATDG